MLVMAHHGGLGDPSSSKRWVAGKTGDGSPMVKEFDGSTEVPSNRTGANSRETIISGYTIDGQSQMQ